MKTHTLSNGTIIKDSRDLSCGISIESPYTKYFSLSYNSEIGFFLNLSSAWLSQTDLIEFNNELNLMSNILNEANSLL